MRLLLNHFPSARGPCTHLSRPVNDKKKKKSTTGRCQKIYQGKWGELSTQCPSHTPTYPYVCTFQVTVVVLHGVINLGRNSDSYAIPCTNDGCMDRQYPFLILFGKISDNSFDK